MECNELFYFFSSGLAYLFKKKYIIFGNGESSTKSEVNEVQAEWNVN